MTVTTVAVIVSMSAIAWRTAPAPGARAALPEPTAAPGVTGPAAAQPLPIGDTTAGDAGRERLAMLAAATSDRAPLAFEAFDDEGGAPRYRAHGPGYLLDVLPTEVRIATLRRPSPADSGLAGERPAPARPGRAMRPGRAPAAFDVSRMVLVGARPATLHAAGRLPSVANRFVGPDPAEWRVGVPHHGRVVAAGVYEGIDLVYYGNGGRLQYDFLVAPGADPGAIALGFPDAASLSLDGDGNLQVWREGTDALVTRAPVLFQDIDGVRRPVEGRFVVDAGARLVRVEVGTYDAAHGLVIDPVLEYGTYFGAQGPNGGVSSFADPVNVGIDLYGNMYIAGSTSGAMPLPVRPGLTTPLGGGDVFLAKFNASGQLVYTTQYGGTGTDEASDMAVAPTGDLVVVGNTGSAALPGSTAPGVYDNTLNGPNDGFVTRFGLNGAPVWATYVGGGSANSEFENDSIERVLIEPTGRILVAGTVLDLGTLNGFDPTFNTNPQAGQFQPTDILVARFSPSGALIDGTYLGTIESDFVFALARSVSGVVYVAGWASATFRDVNGLSTSTSPAFQSTCGPPPQQGEDFGCTILARLGSDLRSLPAASFFGTRFNVTVGDLASDADGTIVFTGQMTGVVGTSSGSVPATAGAFDTTLGGVNDAFVGRMTGDLAQLPALTYLGGAGQDYGFSVKIDAGGQINVSGSTSSSDFPVQNGALKTTPDTNPDAFLVRLQPTLASASYLSRVGGIDADDGARILLGPFGRVYLIGRTAPVTFNETGPRNTVPTTSNAFLNSRAANSTAPYLYRLAPEYDAEYVFPVRTTATTIPDAATLPGTLNSTFTVNGAVGVLDRVEVSFHVTHAVRRQLRATLIGPAGTPSVILFQPNPPVAVGTAFGSSCAARTVLSDAATTLITAGAAPNAGNFRPLNPLSVYSGLTGAQVNGTWNLQFQDTSFGTTGAVQCATVTLFFRRPDITGVSPSGSGVPAAGSAVTILGSNFAANAAVRIGGLPASITSASATSIAALVPAGLGPRPDIAVTNTDGRSAFAIDPFNRVSFTRGRVGDTVIGQVGVSTGNIVQPSLSRDGRWLAFHTGTDRMVPNDTNGVADVFVRDRGASGGPAIVRVSVSSTGQQGNGPSTRAKISASGRYVAFLSSASNLVPDDTNGVADVFVHDRDADGNGVFDETGPGRRATFRVSVASTGAPANGASAQHDLSPDGFWVAFVSSASSLVPGDTNGVDDVFLHHWPSGQTARVSVAGGGAQGNGASRAPGVSAGGRRVVFASDASNLVPGDGNGGLPASGGVPGGRDVFVFDREDRTTTRVSTADGSATADANGPSDNPSIDDRGGTIVFQTRATNILPALGLQTAARWQVVVLQLPALTPFAALRSGEGLSRIGAPVVNIADAIRNLVSGNASGQPSQGDSTNASVNGDGSGVSFQSDGGDLVLGDNNGQPDVFVAPTGGGQAEVVSVTEEGNQGTESSQQAVISDDGSAVAFESNAPLTQDTQNQQNSGTDVTNVFVRGNKLLVTSIAPTSAPLAGGAVTIVGSNFNGVTVRFGGLTATIANQNDSVINLTAPPSPLPQGGAVNVSLTNADGETQTIVNGFTYLAAGGDTDLDGLPDSFEQQFGLDPQSAAGSNGAGGDPDGDGLTNAEELARGSHPTGTFQRFLAEGATNDFFSTRLSLANASGVRTARVLLRFQRSDGTEVPAIVTVPPRESRKLVVNQVSGMGNAEFATLVESDADVIVDRQMWWNSAEAYGTHAEAAVKAPSLVWYLAEGATHSGFDLFYLLQNPSPTDAVVRVRYLLPTGAPIEKLYTIKAGSRANIWVDNEQFPADSGNFALAATDVSAVIEVQNNVPIIVERAMYLTRGSELFSAGHESAGVTAPSLTWFLAEGATGPFFDLFVLLANPNATDAATRVTYLLEDGRTFTQTLTVKANSRQNIWVDFATPDGTTGFPLDQQAISTKVEVTNGVPIIVERAMWWPGAFTQWYEAHNSPGSTVTGTLWGLADGVVGGPVNDPSPATYILVANTEAAATATVAVTLLFDNAAPVTREFSVPPNSRKTIDVNRDFPEARGREFGALVESLPPGGSGAPAQIAVERAIYNVARGLFFAGGNNQLATRLR